MALTDNKIGDFDFLALIGNPLPPVEAVSIDQRPAVAGTSVTRGAPLRDEFGDVQIDNQGNPIRAKQGQPFVMMSRADAANYAAAIQLFDLYVQSCGANPVTMLQGGVSSDSRGFKVVVFSVQRLRAVSVSRSVGGVYGGAILECRWDLIAIANGAGN
jgi:hypothetical protein